MRVLGSGINLKPAQAVIRQTVSRQHAFDGMLDGQGRVAVHHFGQRGFFDTARVTRVAVVFLIFKLVAGDLNF
jgi:hypothetical protein